MCKWETQIHRNTIYNIIFHNIHQALLKNVMFNVCYCHRKTEKRLKILLLNIYVYI